MTLPVCRMDGSADGKRHIAYDEHTVCYNVSMYEWYEEEVRGLEARLAQNPPPPEVVVFYGSSSIRLWETLADDFPDIHTLNLGFGGSTLGACDYFFDRLIPPTHPRAIVCFAGENDLGDGQSPDAVFGAFQALHRKIAALPGDIPFAYLAIKPSPARQPVFAQIQETNHRIRQEITTRPESHWVDVYSPMLEANGQPCRQYWTEDGIHLSAEGYQLWWQILSAKRRELGF